MEWIADNWTTCLAIFWMMEKNVKITPFPYDDILLDIVWSGIKKSVEKVSNSLNYLLKSRWEKKKKYKSIKDEITFNRLGTLHKNHRFVKREWDGAFKECECDECR